MQDDLSKQTATKPLLESRAQSPSSALESRSVSLRVRKPHKCGPADQLCHQPLHLDSAMVVGCHESRRGDSRNLHQQPFFHIFLPNASVLKTRHRDEQILSHMLKP